MTRISARITSIERRIARGSTCPASVQAALVRMEAREALFGERVIRATHWVEAELGLDAREDLNAIPSGTAPRHEQARLVLGHDDDRRHQADRELALSWETKQRGGPGPLAKRWPGNWQTRRLNDLLDRVDREFGIVDEGSRP